MNLAPTLGFIAACLLLWTIITMYLSIESIDGVKYKPSVSPIVPSVLLTLAMLFAAAALYLHTNPHILQ